MNFFQFHRTIKIRIVESFLTSAITSMIFPFMAIYLSENFGLKTAGLLLMINVGMGIVMNFFSGYFADSFGRKKLIVFAESLRFLAFATMMICNSPWYSNPTITFCMMTVNAICWGLSGPATSAMLIDVSKPEQRKSMYTIMYWASNLALAFGGIMGGILFRDYLFELFVALTIATAVAWILITFFIQETYVPKKTEKKSPFKHVGNLFSNYSTVFRDKVFILYTFAGILVVSMEFQLAYYISIRLEEIFPKQDLFGWTVGGLEIIGLLRSENTILVVILMLFAGALASKWKDRHVLVGSCLLFVTGYAIISYTDNMWLLIIAMAAASFAEVVRVPVQQNYLAHLPPEESRSSYLAVDALTYNLSLLISSVTVTLSAFLPAIGTTVFITAIAGVGVLILAILAPALDKRVEDEVKRLKDIKAG